MYFSRREYCLAALGTSLIPAAFWTAQSNRPSRTQASNGNLAEYNSTLVNGLTPRYLTWDDRKWRCAMGSIWNPGMDHCLRLTAKRARFEIRDTPLDRGPADNAAKRRSEMRFPKSPRLPNGVPLWGATSFLHHRREDPEGMAKRWGGVHGQLHIGSTFGGSPAVAFRRLRRGEFAVTTRGENDEEGTVRYRGPLSFDEVHHMVYRVVLHPSDGGLAVWLDGDLILDLRGVSIGSRHAECYWSFGCYYSGGITCPIIAEYGDHFYPSQTDLRNRIKFRPDWS